MADSFWGGPGGAATISGGLGLLGGLFSGIGQGKMNDQQMQQAWQIFQAQLQQSGHQFDQETQMRLFSDMINAAQQQSATDTGQDITTAGQDIDTGMGVAQADTNTTNDLYKFDQQQQMDRDKTGMGLFGPDPYALQSLRQKQALFGAMLPQARNAQISSGVPGMDRFIPKMTGGAMNLIPEGGFGQDVLSKWSPEQLAQAEGDWWKQAAPFAEGPDLSKYYGQAGVAPTSAAAGARTSFIDSQGQATADRNAQIAQIQGTRNNALKQAQTTRNQSVNAIRAGRDAKANDYRSFYDSEMAKSRQKQSALMAGLTQQTAMAAPKEKKKGFWGKLGGALMGIAPIAASFIPGVGPALGAAIGLGGGAAKNVVAGGSKHYS